MKRKKKFIKKALVKPLRKNTVSCSIKILFHICKIFLQHTEEIILQVYFHFEGRSTTQVLKLQTQACIKIATLYIFYSTLSITHFIIATVQQNMCQFKNINIKIVFNLNVKSQQEVYSVYQRAIWVVKSKQVQQTSLQWSGITDYFKW